MSVFPFRLLVALWLCTHVCGVQVWTTTLNKTQLLARQGDLTPIPGTASTTTVVTLGSALYQEIYGFGGALTETSAINFVNLNQTNHTNYMNILRSLFDPSSGAGLSVIRVPISSTDMSLSPYFTHDDNYNDQLFKDFSWNRDSTYILPVLKDIISISPNIKILISPWTAPNWMKTSVNASNAFTWGTINPTYYDNLAYFFQITIQKFAQMGINIYALTIQNEPTNVPNSYPVMGCSANDEAQIAILLGRRFASNGITTKILVWDDNWDGYQFPIDVLNNTQANPFIAGSAFHCYNGNVSGQLYLNTAFPKKEIWFTECSGTGTSSFSGNIPWATINLYIGSINNWARAVFHFNLATNTSYGPKASGGCSDCRGFITVQPGNLKVTYNEEYYGTAMFNKFLSYPAYRMECVLTGGWNCVTAICFKTANSSSVIVVGNFCGSSQSVIVQGSVSYLSTTVPIGLTTFIW